LHPLKNIVPEPLVPERAGSSPWWAQRLATDTIFPDLQ